MNYECVKEFEVDRYDDDGIEVIGTMTVEKGSIWELNNHHVHVIDGENHLDRIDDAEWLEISKEMLSFYFKEIKE